MMSNDMCLCGFAPRQVEFSRELAGSIDIVDTVPFSGLPEGIDAPVLDEETNKKKIKKKKNKNKNKHSRRSSGTDEATAATAHSQKLGLVDDPTETAA